MPPIHALRPAMVAAFLILLAAPLGAQPLPENIPEGAVLPQNLNALGDMMVDHVSDLIREEVAEEQMGGSSGRQLDIFSGSTDEDPNLAIIRKIAKELETQRSVILKLADLQSNLIAFAVKDPHAAYRSRIPVRVCELAIAPEFCTNLTASFR